MTLYTQAQRIEVIVRKEDTAAATAGANEETADGINTGTSGDGVGSGGTPTSARDSKINKRIISTKVLSAGIAVTRLAVNYYVGGVGYRNGDSAQQEAVQRNIELVEESAGILLSIGIGATYGVRGGAVGMIVGGAVAAATTGTSLAVKYLGKSREYNMKVFKEENAIEYRRARANLSLTSGRLR